MVQTDYTRSEGGAVFKGGFHRMQRCSVYENASPDPDVAEAHYVFSAGGIAVARATVEMEQGVISGNFGRGGGAAVRSAGALRLVGTLVGNNSGSLGFVGGSAGGVFVDGGALAAVNVTWAGNQLRDLVNSSGRCHRTCWHCERPSRPRTSGLWRRSSRRSSSAPSMALSISSRQEAVVSERALSA